MSSTPLLNNFALNLATPLDNRIIATNSTQRNSIVYLYDGLKVFQLDTRTSYVYNLSSATWSIDSSNINSILNIGNSSSLSVILYGSSFVVKDSSTGVTSSIIGNGRISTNSISSSYSVSLYTNGSTNQIQYTDNLGYTLYINKTSSTTNQIQYFQNASGTIGIVENTALNNILNVGNTTSNAIYINNNLGNKTIGLTQGKITTYSTASTTSLSLYTSANGSINEIQYLDSSGNILHINKTASTTSQTQSYQDASGTIALVETSVINIVSNIINLGITTSTSIFNPIKEFILTDFCYYVASTTGSLTTNATCSFGTNATYSNLLYPIYITSSYATYSVNKVIVPSGNLSVQPGTTLSFNVINSVNHSGYDIKINIRGFYI